MHWLKKGATLALLAGTLSLALGGCSEGPAERAGKKVDQTVEKGADRLEDAGDKVEKKIK